MNCQNVGYVCLVPIFKNFTDVEQRNKMIRSGGDEEEIMAEMTCQLKVTEMMCPGFGHVAVGSGKQCRPRGQNSETFCELVA